jgi:GntR family transcriptional regulator, transcriptional repressor for pyruvate dehydrogenase complex
LAEATGGWRDDEDLPVRPVLRAFEQVADQLREMILSGRLSSGQRLPTEAELCERFSVSRSTVREALRMLATEGLVRTARGATGGTFVAVPQTDAVVDFLTGTFSLMAGSREVTVLELLEARELLEVPAARMTAEHRTDGHIDRLRDAIVPNHQSIDRTRLFEINRAFHEVILIAAPNRLLRVMGAPLFTTLHSRFLRDRATPDFWDLVMADHAEILAAIADRAPDEAAAAMARHLHNLRPTYEHIDALHEAEHAGGLTLDGGSG